MIAPQIDIDRDMGCSKNSCDGLKSLSSPVGQDIHYFLNVFHCFDIGACGLDARSNGSLGIHTHCQFASSGNRSECGAVGLCICPHRSRSAQ